MLQIASCEPALTYILKRQLISIKVCKQKQQKTTLKLSLWLTSFYRMIPAFGLTPGSFLLCNILTFERTKVTSFLLRFFSQNTKIAK